MANKIPSFLLEPSSHSSFEQERGKVKAPFLERGINHLSRVIKEGYAQWEVSSQKGFFHRIDARVKVLFLLFFILIVSLKKDLASEIYIWIFVFVLTLLSRLNPITLYKRILPLAFMFGFLVALPSAFNVIVRGEMILPVIKLPRSYHFWIYHIPADIGITREGMYAVMMLTLRVINSLSLSFLVLYTTPFPEIMRALKVLKAPDSFLLIITLCYKYIFLFSKTVEDMHLAKKSRMVREASHAEAREWIAGRILFIFKKTRLRWEEVFKAMIGRGFSGSIHLRSPAKLGRREGWVGTFLFLIGVLLLWI